MKKVLIVILFLLFAAGIYFNFSSTGSLFTNESTEEGAEETKITGEEQQESEDTTSEDTPEEEQQEPNSKTDGLVFNEQTIQDKYDERVNNNEPLIIDVLLPAHYSTDFTERLSQQIGSDTVQFNQLELPANTTDMNELTVNENSDVIILDALQIADYNDEVLPQRNLNNLTGAYMDLYNTNKTVIILGNPNVHEHENLMATLEDDVEHFSENDYFYIDNQEILTESPYDYDAEQINPALEDEIINSISSYLLQ